MYSPLSTTGTPNTLSDQTVPSAVSSRDLICGLDQKQQCTVHSAQESFGTKHRKPDPQTWFDTAIGIYVSIGEL